MKCGLFVVVLLIASVRADDATAGQRLASWLASSGGFFDNSALELVELGDGLGRGFVSQRDIGAGQLLVEIPSSMMFTEASALRTLPDYLFPTLDEEHAALERLYRMPMTNAMALLLLCHREMGALSPFAAYFDWLPPVEPASIVSTLGYDAEQLAALRGSSLYDNTVKRNEAVARFWRELTPPWNRFSLLEFKWALHVLWSRTISVRVDKQSSQGEGALVPIADLFNAGLTSPVRGRVVDCRAAPETLCLQYRSAEPIAAGSHVLMQYGSKTRLSDAELMFYYGFALPDNPANVVRLRVDCPDDDDDDDDGALAAARRDVLHQLGLGSAELAVAADTDEIAQDALMAATVCVLDRDEMAHWQQLLRVEPPPQLVQRAQQLIGRLVDAKLRSYATSVQQDRQQLEQLGPQHWRYNVLLLLIGEKQLLANFARRLHFEKSG